MAPEEIVRRLDQIPVGSSETFYRNRRYLVTKQLFNGGLSVKLYAEALGERDFISLNHYRTNTGDHLRPCEMPSEIVIHFLEHHIPVPPGNGNGEGHHSASLSTPLP
jgi:hypothetical protein